MSGYACTCPRTSPESWQGHLVDCPQHDGGPAFPNGYNMSTSEGAARPARERGRLYGVTLRDHFAASVDVTAFTPLDLDRVTVEEVAQFAKSAAQWRYLVADAMMAERAK